MRKALGFVAVAALLTAPSGPALGATSWSDMVANLKSPNSKTRLDAASALGKSRRPEAVDPLVTALRSEPEPKVRLEVVKALRELRNRDAVPALVGALSDLDPKVREEALGTLVELYAERERSTPVSKFLELFSDEDDKPSVGPFTQVDPSVYRALATALRDEEKGIREAAAHAIGILDGRSVVADLTLALQDVEPGVRGAAASAIGKVGSERDGVKLIPILADENAGVRTRALRAIGTLRVREAGPALREMFEANRRRESARLILDSLSRVADPGQAELFRELVKDADPERKRLAIEGLARVADASMLSAFKKDFQRERSDEIRLAYAFALVRLGDKDFLDSLVLALPSGTNGRRCRGYILELGKEVLQELYPYLNDQDAEIRAELCEIIGGIGDSSSLAWLEPLLKDPSPKVADRANRAVERLRRSKGVETGSLS